jgi:hydroxymethylglutaryl-CoA reductase
MKPLSRFPGFHRLSVSERRAGLLPHSTLSRSEFDASLLHGGLDERTADKMVENTLGTYSLPFGVALNFTINGVDHVAPMVVEEPSVIAAASNAARMIRKSGGFIARTLGNLMTTQIQISGVTNPETAVRRLRDRTPELLQLAARAVPGLVSRGGGPRKLEVRDLGEGYLVVHVYVNCGDAMGANLVNSVAEALGPRVAEIGGGKLGLRILSNLCDARRIRVFARVHLHDLKTDAHCGEEVMDAIVSASRFAELDPYRAATHNKGIMNGVDSVVLATGNDYRAVEAGAHAFACRTGRYLPLCTWHRDGEMLSGKLELPLSLGIVGGTSRLHPTARFAIKLAGVRSANELAKLAASVGLASNLAALRALSTYGIQRGHMSLHARSVATLAGARDDEVDTLAQGLSQARPFNLDTAKRMLKQLRREESDCLNAAVGMAK